MKRLDQQNRSDKGKARKSRSKKDTTIFIPSTTRKGRGYYMPLDKWADSEHQKELDKLAQVDDEPMSKEEDCDSQYDNEESR